MIHKNIFRPGISSVLTLWLALWQNQSTQINEYNSINLDNTAVVLWSYKIMLNDLFVPPIYTIVADVSLQYFLPLYLFVCDTFAVVKSW